MQEHAVNYDRAVAEAAAYLSRKPDEALTADLPALLAGWGGEGEALLYPMPALVPAACFGAVA